MPQILVCGDVRGKTLPVLTLLAEGVRHAQRQILHLPDELVRGVCAAAGVARQARPAPPVMVTAVVEALVQRLHGVLKGLFQGSFARLRRTAGQKCRLNIGRRSVRQP